MQTKKSAWLTAGLFALALCLSGFGTSFAAVTQSDERALSCDERSGGDRDGRRTHCEMREQTIAAGGAVSVDGRQNGGVSVKGWDKNEILVRAKVQASAPTEDEARAIANEVRVQTAGAQIRADGPETRGNRWWAVSYEVFVPRRSDLSLKAHNGGIAIRDVAGRIEFDTVNGGVSLRELGGSVKGKTVNGGLSVALTGSRWDGEGLNVQTTNGDVSLAVPENYSARLEASTVNGGMRFDFPVTVQGKIEKDVAVDLGGGGPLVRAVTTNGGISVKRK
jgi:DUF4097 and DUF4098 domain-containing protein YvlB